jgi:hypothetical protein
MARAWVEQAESAATAAAVSSHDTYAGAHHALPSLSMHFLSFLLFNLLDTPNADAHPEPPTFYALRCRLHLIFGC